MEQNELIRLLIVEDERTLREGIAALPWDSCGITLLPPAKNGEEAIDCVQKYQVDILLTDIRIPGPSGLEVAEQVRALYPRAEILILSGYEEFGYAQKAISLRTSGYILKPSTPRDIVKAVIECRDRILGGRRLDQDYSSMKQELSQLTRVMLTTGKQEKQETPDQQDISRITAYIGEHYPEPLTLVGLAEAFHFNAVYLSRYIKKRTGHTFSELLTSTRMYHAARLLRSTDLKNAEICVRIGMNDERYFGQVFHKAYGVSPQEYRRSQQPLEDDLLERLLGGKK